MKAQLCCNGALVGALFGGWMILIAPAGAAQTNQVPPATSITSEVGQGGSAKPEAGQRGDANADGTAKHSLGVDDILRMVAAGVSADVIKAYIENSPIAYSLKAADIIALKEHGVPDDIAKALVKRGAELRTQVGRNLNAISNRRYNALDPDGYDYFQYYYLYPRTLAAANQRLFAPSGPYSGFSWPAAYGYWGPLPFQPLPHTFFRGP
jgi:hypothetical protein